MIITYIGVFSASEISQLSFQSLTWSACRFTVRPSLISLHHMSAVKVFLTQLLESNLLKHRLSPSLMIKQGWVVDHVAVFDQLV